MTPQQEIFKIVVDLHAKSKEKERQLASNIRAISKKAEECEKWAQSAHHPESKKAWDKLLGSLRRLEKMKKEDLKNYEKDIDVFGKIKRELEGGGRFRK